MTKSFLAHLNLIEPSHRGLYRWWTIRAWWTTSEIGMKLGPMTFLRYWWDAPFREHHYFVGMLGWRVLDTGLTRLKRGG